jgi:phosphinothricin acetyltransferase
MLLTARPAERGDAAAIAAIYNQGIEDRVGTFETAPRTPVQIEAWFDSALPVVVAIDDTGEVVAYAAAFAYSDRCVYGGIAEFSVYVRRDVRGQGAGTIAMTGLIEAAARAGLWKLLSRIFPENAASRALMRKLGFREVGVHEKHGKLDGVWRDVVLVERLIDENL